MTEKTETEQKVLDAAIEWANVMELMIQNPLQFFDASQEIITKLYNIIQEYKKEKK